MKYYIIAGEASGDLHGANLMRGLKEEDTDADFRIWGGEYMVSAGGCLVRHYKETAVMGFVEVAGSLRKILANLSLCKKDILAYKPDLLILIDYPGFNFKIAKFAKNNGIPVFYYISPTVWAWKEWRLKNIRRDVDRLFIIYPFEQEYFKNKGIEAVYNGNPLLDSIATHSCQNESREDFLKRNRLPEKPVIALLAGSRMMEINYLMPRMIKIESFFPDYQFLLAGAPSIDSKAYEKYLKRSCGNIKLLFGETYSILKHAEVAVLASGTASLEAAIINTPQVVCYGGNELSFRIAKSLVKTKYISLVNLILDRPAVKELIQHDCTTENMVEEIKKIISGKMREDVLTSYTVLKNMLGEYGASRKVARSMIKEFKKYETQSLLENI